MGEWLNPDPAVLLTDVLDSSAFRVPKETRTALAFALRETGFLVPTAYYVPDVSELFNLYHQLAEVDYHARRNIRHSIVRWVMCGETQLALQRKYDNVRAVHSPHVDDIHMMMTTRAAASLPAALDAGRLFDMPIRRDPAARRPLFELIPLDERT